MSVWMADPELARDRGLIEALLAKHDRLEE